MDVSVEIGQLRGDVIQLSELTELERSYIQRLVDALKQLHGYVGSLVEVKQNGFGMLQNQPKKVYLAPGAEVVFEYTDGKMESRPLMDFPAESIVSVINDAAPEFKRLLSEKRKSVSARINLLEKVLNEFDKMPLKAKSVKEEAVSDLIESSIS